MSSSTDLNTVFALQRRLSRANNLAWGLGAAAMVLTVVLCSFLFTWCISRPHATSVADSVVSRVTARMEETSNATALRAASIALDSMVTPQAPDMSSQTVVSGQGVLISNTHKRFLFYAYDNAGGEWPAADAAAVDPTTLDPSYLYLMHVNASGGLSGIPYAEAFERKFVGSVFTISADTDNGGGDSVVTSFLFRGGYANGGYYLNKSSSESSTTMLAFLAGEGEKKVALRHIPAGVTGSRDQALPCMDMNAADASTNAAVTPETGGQYLLAFSPSTQLFRTSTSGATLNTSCVFFMTMFD